MTTDRADRDALEELEFRLRSILPEEYQDTYELMQPTPMRAAGLVFDAAGLVAWNQIWGSFCDLAVAGGPPHKGALLKPGSATDVDANPDRYREVVSEICRGITMVTGLAARSADVPGWVAITCVDATMAAWLLRAIVVENVGVHAEGSTLYLPAAPAFRLEKEIKNVVTVIAKTCHYWAGHMPGLQRAAIGRMFASIESEVPLLAPPWPWASEPTSEDRRLARVIDRGVYAATRLPASAHGYPGWLGVECPNVRSAVWIMRALVASNVLSRREGGAVFVPVNPEHDPEGDRVVRAFVHVHGLATLRGVA